MGAIWFKQSDLVEKVFEYVGYKSGLALTAKSLAKYIPEEYRPIWSEKPDAAIRLRSEAFQELIADTLFNLGVPDPGCVPFFAPLASISQKDPRFAEMFEDLKAAVTRFERRKGEYDIVGLLQYASAKYDVIGSELAMELATNPKARERSPWGVFRDIEWQDVRQLDDLFQSENLATFHGKYFDQRFVDFLAGNGEELPNIQWRQFEGLTAEYFGRQGYKVVLGPGRDDDNIDVRAWADGNVGPPTILIQCKREKKEVGKVVVKALYADILHERAESGLIVTTSALSPGAEKIRTARGYPIEEADRAKVLQWIKAMRSG